jgi:hypothetical protein
VGPVAPSIKKDLERKRPTLLAIAGLRFSKRVSPKFPHVFLKYPGGTSWRQRANPFLWVEPMDSGPKKNISRREERTGTGPAQRADFDNAELELDAWSGQIDRLTARAELLGAEAKAAALEQLVQLKKRFETAEQKLAAHRSLPHEKASAAKAEFDAFWIEVRGLFEKPHFKA